MTDVTKNASMEQHKASQECLGIGKLITSEQHRDAIHVAIVPVEAGHQIYPHQPVAVKDGKAWLATQDSIGIADPFLIAPIFAGDRFWLFLYPGSITSLRHVWTHPALDDEQNVPARPSTNVSDSEAWLREFCRTADCPDYDRMIDALRNGEWQSGDGYNYIRIEDDYIAVGGTDAHGDIPAEFWDHAERVTGRKFAERPTYFSCSC